MVHALLTVLTDADIHFALNGGLVQRGEVPVVSGIGVSPVLQQRGDDLGVPKGAGVVQGDQAAWVSGRGKWEGMEYRVCRRN